MKLHIEDNTTINVSVGEVVNVGVDQYDGPYEFAPSQETQTIPIGGKQAREDIVIDALPSYYGRIDFNGSVITVS